MPKSQWKKEILENASYVFIFKRDIYFNRKDKKIFSLEAIEDNDPNWLIEKINDSENDGEWRFFFNNHPSEKLKKEILKGLGE